jgi:hypothetical protein
VTQDIHAELFSEEQLNTLIDAGFLCTRKVVFVALDFEALPRKHGCEGTLHRALKTAAANMLASIGEKEVKLEHYDFDVFGVTLGSHEGL